MKFSESITFIYLGLISATGASIPSNKEDYSFDPPSDISLSDFQEMLCTEIDNEVEVAVTGESTGSLPKNGNNKLRGRYLKQQSMSPLAKDKWSRIVKHGWDISAHQSSMQRKNFGNNRKHRRNTEAPMLPFIVCSHSSKYKSAFQRFEPMLERTGAYLKDASIVLNDPKKTCYHISLKYEAANEIRSAMISRKDEYDDDDDHLTILPITDLMKIQVNTMTEVFEDKWIVPETVSSSDDWERLIRVGLSTGRRLNLNDKEVVDVAREIIDDIRSAALAGANNRRSRRLQKDEKNVGEPSSVSSLSELFSLTSEQKKLSTRNLRRISNGGVLESIENQNKWKTSLKFGLEAEHSCQVMFDTFRVDAHFNNKGFDIVLNPRPEQDTHSIGIDKELNNNGIDQKRHDDVEALQCKNGIECSASNKHCVASLIMALSTHPLVLSIETEGPPEMDDFESQWITQSKTEGKRPLRGSGITGQNQIITVIDSGVDMNHRYFGPTSDTVFDRWDYSQRKVVKYDHSLGDKTEPRGGHGTKCAGAAAGKVAGVDNKANGVAEDAKLHIIDIQFGNGGLRIPNAFSIFQSMHSTGGQPSRIASGSWSTAYNAYPHSCSFFDEALHDFYPGDLYVASIGNNGYDENNEVSKMRTVGNPASCKNTLAVGASESHGDRLPAGAKGIEYMAAFSSRGPTYDDRMKPDLVAPGASVLTPYAHDYGKTVQVYGTSFSAPTVAGNAALVRQYFTEGHLPCDWKNGCKLNPSGSLVKAVLMNSAMPLKEEVQVTQPWLEKKLLGKVSEYDGNQGMGLVQLDTSLPLPGKNSIRAIVKNNKQIADGQTHDIYIQAAPGTCSNTSYQYDLKVTLAWYDPPGAISCAKCLVNDLDLTIHSVTANGGVKPNSTLYPNGLDSKDDRNNVERIRFQMDNNILYRIRVQASNLVTATTKYSLIGSGCFQVIPDPTQN